MLIKFISPFLLKMFHFSYMFIVVVMLQRQEDEAEEAHQVAEVVLVVAMSSRDDDDSASLPKICRFSFGFTELWIFHRLFWISFLDTQMLKLHKSGKFLYIVIVIIFICKF